MTGSRGKGITPVISTILLLTIAVSAAATAWQFQENISDQFRDTANTRLEQEEVREKTDINIEFMYNSSEGNYTLMSLANTGSLALDVENNDEKKVRIFVDDGPITDENGDGNPRSWNYVNKDDPGDVVLDGGDAILINTTESFPALNGRKNFEVTAPFDNSDTKICVNTGGSSC